MNIRYFESMSACATILIADKKISLLKELRDDSKDTFFVAVGLSTYSSSRVVDSTGFYAILTNSIKNVFYY